MCEPSTEIKLVFTMLRRSHQSDKLQFSMNGGFHVMKKEWGTIHLNVNRSPLTIVELKFGFAELKILHF